MNNWWREPAPFARPRRPRIDHFLAHVLGAETGQKISMRELYAEYRAFAVPRGGLRFQNIEDELGMLGRYSPLYETLEGRVIEDEDLHWLGRKLAAWQVTTAYPVAMQVSMSSIDDEEKAELYQSDLFLHSATSIVRTDWQEPKQGVPEHFAGFSAARAVRRCPWRATLHDKDGDSTRFPDDDEFRQGILSKPAYRTCTAGTDQGRAVGI